MNMLLNVLIYSFEQLTPV